MSSLENIYGKVFEGKRISTDEAALLLAKADLLQLGSLADIARKRFNPENIVTFVADTNPKLHERLRHGVPFLRLLETRRAPTTPTP